MQYVQLKTENPVLNGLLCKIIQETEYGAIVQTGVGTGQYRACHCELVQVACNGDICSACGSLNMFRAGACLTCANCGTSGGCG